MSHETHLPELGATVTTGGEVEALSGCQLVSTPRVVEVCTLELAGAMRRFDAALTELGEAYAQIPAARRAGTAARIRLRGGLRIHERIATTQLELSSVEFIFALQAVEDAWRRCPERAREGMAVDIVMVEDGTLRFDRPPR